MAAVIMMVALDQLVNRTRIGRSIRATAQDPEAAVLMGVNIDTVVRLTFLLGGAMAGVAAVLYDIQFENTQYNVGFVLGIKAFTAAVLGGIGNLRGALLGGHRAGARGELGIGVLRLAVEGRHRLPRARHRPDLPANRHPRRVVAAGAGMSGSGGGPMSSSKHRARGRGGLTAVRGWWDGAPPWQRWILYVL